MRWLIVAVALVAACRGRKPARKDAGPTGPALSVSVPKLPPSDDGVAELAALDKRIELAGSDARKRVPLLLERAAIRGRLEDYEGAVNASAELVGEVKPSGERAEGGGETKPSGERAEGGGGVKPSGERSGEVKPSGEPGERGGGAKPSGERSGEVKPSGEPGERGGGAKPSGARGERSVVSKPSGERGGEAKPSGERGERGDVAEASGERAERGGAAAPVDAGAWHLRVRALLRVHDFAGARAALGKLAPLVHPSELVEHQIVLAEATGDAARAIAMRGELAQKFASPTNLTAWAVALAQDGRTDEALAIIPKAAAAVRDNPPALLAWLLFQWGRIYALAGQHAAARAFFAEAHARLPGYVEATVHLAEAMIATRDTEGARKLVEDALAADRQAVPGAKPHPELMSLAIVLGHTELAEGAREEWERYVAALPLAFADHAARFYLTVYRHPARALELARINFGNRPTREARALLVEAALEAGDSAEACAAVDKLVSGGTRAQRFTAWKALAQCGRNSDANRLARELGIAPGIEH